MVTLKQILFAAVATALVAAQAAAGDYWSDPAPQRSSKVRAVRYNTDGRKVTVWRDLAKASQATPDSGNPFDAPDSGDATEEVPGPEPVYDNQIASQCGSSCDDCGTGGFGCCDNRPFWAHRTAMFGEYLYLRPTGVDLPHAIEQTNLGGSGVVPDGSVFAIQPQFTQGFRAGFAVALSDCTSVVATYANFSSHVTSSIEAAADMTSTVLHPNSANFGTLTSFIDATYDIDFQTIDVEYRAVLCGGCNGAVNYSIGGRYGKLVQEFEQLQAFLDEDGGTLTATNILFEGGGLRTGLDFTRRLDGTRLALYGKSFINVLFGEFTSEYVELDSTTESTVQAFSSWVDNRVVPVLECEAGLRFTSWNGRWSTSTGYYASFWFNSVTTSELIHAVQTSNFLHAGQTVAFDGLVSRLEYRF